jgi:hypothetical protein
MSFFFQQQVEFHFKLIQIRRMRISVFHVSSFKLSGKFQTEIGKSWAAEINSRRKSRSENRHN